MKKSDQALYTKAVDLVKNLDTSFLGLARILSQAQSEQNPLYPSLMKLPGLDRRTAYYLIEIDKVFASLGVDKSILESIGWTKLSRISKHVTKSNVDAMLALAQTHTDRQLQFLLAGKKLPKRIHVVQLFMTPRLYQKYRSAMLTFGATKSPNGLSGQEKALNKLLSKSLKNK